MNGKVFAILNPWSFVGSFSDLAAKTQKNLYHVQTFIEGEGNRNTKRKTESYIFSGFGNGISRG